MAIFFVSTHTLLSMFCDISFFLLASSIANSFFREYGKNTRRKITKKPLNHKRTAYSDRLYLLASNYSRFSGLPCYVAVSQLVLHVSSYKFLLYYMLPRRCIKIANYFLQKKMQKNFVVILDALRCNKQVGETRIKENA